MVEGLIAAAGRSRRTGEQYKMLLDLEGMTLIERAIAPMEPWCSRIIVVTGHRGHLLRPVLEGWSKVEMVDNPDYDQGMFSSIKKGLPLITAERFFFLPGDYALVSNRVYQAMLEVDAPVVVPAYQGRTGHPVLFRSGVIDDILSMPNTDSLRDFMARPKPHLLEVDCPGILIDIDTMEDYQQAREWLAAQGGL